MWRIIPASTLMMLCLARASLPNPLAVPFQASLKTTVVTDFRAGEKALREGHYDLAVKEYQEVLRLDPNLVQARVNLGLAYHALGQYRLAIQELEEASHRRRNVPAIDLFLGLDYMKLGSPAKAVPHLRAALRSPRSRSEAQASLLACYRSQGNYEDTIELLKTIADREPLTAEQSYEVGQGYLAMAVKLADTLSRDHHSAWANHLAGDMLAVRGHWSDAAVKYREALAIDDAQPGLHIALGRMYLHQAKYAKAEVEFKTGLRRNHCEEDALLGLAEIGIAHGSPIDTLDAILKIWDVFPPNLARAKGHLVITLDPSQNLEMAGRLEAAHASPARSFLLASLYNAAGDLQASKVQWVAFQRSLNSWKRSLDVASTHEKASKACQNHQYSVCAYLLARRSGRSLGENLTLGRSLLALGKEKAAAQTFAAALFSDHNNPAAAYWLVRTSLGLGEKYLRMLVTLFPNTWRAHEFRGDSDRLRFDASGAIREYSAAIRQHPDSAELYDDLGRAYFMEGDQANAESALKKALRLDPHRASALYILGSIYLTEHENQKSTAYLQAAVHSDPELIDAHAALGRAYMRNGEPRSALPELEKAAPTDVHGDVHYLLYEAYHMLGKQELARAALLRSLELRRNSAETMEQNVRKAFEEEHRK